MSQTADSIRADGGLAAGSDGTILTKFIKGTVAVDLASLATVTAADASITITGAVVGDIVILNPPTAAMTAGMLVAQAHVSAADTVKARVYNASGGTVDEASGTWTYLLIRS